MAFHIDMPERTVAGPISLPPDEPEAPFPDDADQTPLAQHTSESTAVGMVEIPTPQTVEPTRIGVVMPDERPKSSMPPSLLSPTGQIYAPTARFEMPEPSGPGPAKPALPSAASRSRLETGESTRQENRESTRPKRRPTPVTHGRSLPPTAREQGLDSELDDTQRLDAEDVGLEPASIPRVEPKIEARVEPRPLSEKGVATHVGDLSKSTGESARSSSSEREVSLGAGPNGLYERVAAGVYVPEEPKAGPVSSGRVRAKSWNEPSAYVEPKSALARMLETFRRTAMVLNGAPLALKAALVVFPVTLGIALMLTSAGDSAPVRAPVEIPPETAVAAPPEKKVDTKVIEPILPKRSAPPTGDDAAEEGRAYVQVERARLRAEAGENAEAIGRLEIGALVRTYESIDGFVLVMAEPKGPAGFISEKLIGAKKPIALLAKERAFAACEVTSEYTIDDCLYQGKQQHDACTESCGVAVAGGGVATEDNPALRCAEACKVAFNECSRSCNGEDAAGAATKKKSPAPSKKRR